MAQSKENRMLLPRLLIKDDTYTVSAIDLPYELLQDIFRLAYSRNTIHNTPQSPDFLICGQVCSYWRRALIADLYMWSRITLPGYAPDLVLQCLSNSKDRPLEIYIGGSHPLLEDVLSQMYRIKSLFLETQPDENYCRKYLSRPAPCLEILCMSGPEIITTFGLKDLFQHQTPNIKHLHLKGTLAFPFKSMFHDLVHLNLQNSPDFPPLNRLLDILELSPNLQEFLFRCDARHNSNTASLEDIPKDRNIEIPLLSRIELRASSSILLLLIRHIVIPDGTQWSLKCSDLNIMLDRTFLSFLSRHSVGRSGLQCLIIGKIIYISLYKYDDGDTEKKVGELLLRVFSQEVLLSLRTLFGSEALSRVTSLELDYTNLSLIKNFYDNIIWHFPNVWHLTVNATVQSTQTISCFSDALSTKAEDGSLPCPSLTHLVVCARINTTTALEALVSCFHRRHTLHNPVQSLKIVDETFQINEEDMEKLTQYIPDVQIVKKKDNF